MVKRMVDHKDKTQMRMELVEVHYWNLLISFFCDILFSLQLHFPSLHPSLWILSIVSHLPTSLASTEIPLLLPPSICHLAQHIIHEFPEVITKKEYYDAQSHVTIISSIITTISRIFSYFGIYDINNWFMVPPHNNSIDWTNCNLDFKMIACSWPEFQSKSNTLFLWEICLFIFFIRRNLFVYNLYLNLNWNSMVTSKI